MEEQNKTIHRFIKFEVITSTKQTRFEASYLSEDDTSKLVDAFSAAVTEDMAQPMSQEDCLEPFRNFFPADSKASQEEDHPENEFYQDTGIKYKQRNGEWQPNYRLRYMCPNRVCNNKGIHFIPEGTKAVKCHNCKERMDVRDATKIGFPNKDSYNNFYHAGDEQ